MISSDNLKEYLESFSLNLVKTNNSRWIDQKVSFDNLSIVSDCIINYTENIEKWRETVAESSLKMFKLAEWRFNRYSSLNSVVIVK